MKRPRPAPLAVAVLCVFLVEGCSEPNQPVSPRPETAASSALASASHSGKIHTVAVNDRTLYLRTGEVSETRVITTSYDAHGNALLVVDEMRDMLSRSSRTVTASEYSKRGNLVSQVLEMDSQIDGTIDYRRVVSSTAFDDQGNPTETWVEYDGGPGSAVGRRTRISASYDAKGRPLWKRYDEDWGGEVDGVIDVRYEYDFTYGAHGHVVRLGKSGYVQDGVADFAYSERLTSTYNHHGALVSELFESSIGADPQRDRTVFTDAFDRQGNPVARRYADTGLRTQGTWSTEFDGQRRPVREEIHHYRTDTGSLTSHRVSTYRYQGPGGAQSSLFTYQDATFPYGLAEPVAPPSRGPGSPARDAVGE